MSNRSKSREPLQAIPSAPLNKRPTRITTSSLHPSLQDPSTCLLKSPEATDPLTPPTTPLKARNETPALIFDVTQFRGMSLGETNTVDAPLSLGATKKRTSESEKNPNQECSWEETTPRICTKKYQLLRGPASSGYQEYGRGAWSVVYRAVESTTAVTPPGLPTPPNSPTNNLAFASAHIKDTLAIKAPTRRDAHKILEEEARILTYLHQYPHATDHLVAFYGYDEPQHSIVLDAVPTSLDTYARSAGNRARANLSGKTMFDPVVGISEWSHLAERLISGLAYLHDRQCVHGDIKPANILLRSITEDGHMQPIYCDFSSSHIMSKRPDDIEESSGVTPDYSSPELLESFYRRRGDRAVVTFASDVFALAVTLLVAAIGDSPYAIVRNDIQKLGFAKEGRPFEFARMGNEASRVMKGKLVERALRGGVEKDPAKRMSVVEWKNDVSKTFEGKEKTR